MARCRRFRNRSPGSIEESIVAARHRTERIRPFTASTTTPERLRGRSAGLDCGCRCYLAVLSGPALHEAQGATVAADAHAVSALALSQSCSMSEKYNDSNYRPAQIVEGMKSVVAVGLGASIVPSLSL